MGQQNGPQQGPGGNQPMNSGTKPGMGQQGGMGQMGGNQQVSGMSSGYSMGSGYGPFMGGQPGSMGLTQPNNMGQSHGNMGSGGQQTANDQGMNQNGMQSGHQMAPMSGMGVGQTSLDQGPINQGIGSMGGNQQMGQQGQDQSMGMGQQNGGMSMMYPGMVMGQPGQPSMGMGAYGNQQGPMPTPCSPDTMPMARKTGQVIRFIYHCKFA